MANFRKFYNKITEDTTIEDRISEKKTKDKTKKGAYVIVLTDSDIKSMIKLKIEGEEADIDYYLEDKFMKFV